jgi:hypothetical protein
VICDHKDCERTDTTPVELTLLTRDREVVETRTYHFCPDHSRQLLRLKTSRTLPPEEWFEPSGAAGP